MNKSTPISISIDEGLYNALKERSDNETKGSLSKLVRKAIEQFDYDSFEDDSSKIRGLSIRVSPIEYSKVKETAVKNGVSLNQVIRKSLESYLNSKASGEMESAKTSNNASTENSDDFLQI